MKTDLNFSVMLDCSRNAVFKPSEVKKFADIIARMGYKELYLYTEDTYEIEGEEYFGYLRGKYTQKELKDIDAYCRSVGIELVPCIQVLAHLGAIFRWRKYLYMRDINDILLVGDEKTYELIDKMFETISKTFTSKKLHIGMDEAHNIGRGTFLDENGYCDRYDLLLQHLDRVKKIADKYGFQINMWSDMFFRAACRGYTYEGLDEVALKAAADKLPKGVTVTYWEYYATDKTKYNKMLELHKKYFPSVMFAGGAIEWYGYAPFNEQSCKIAKAAVAGVRENQIQDVMVTLWGDGGGQGSFYSVLPTLLYYIEVANGNEDMEIIKKKFDDLMGISWDTFMLLDLPNKVDNPYVPTANPSLYMLYNDYFSGVFDCTVKEGDGEIYSEYARRLKEHSSNGEYAYIFDVLYKLCDVLSVKYELGIKTRKAYQEKDVKTLRSLAENEYDVLPKKLKALLEAQEMLWLKENKSSGIEVEQIRLGGLMQRAEFCKKLLLKHLDEGVKIAELEEPLLDFYGNGTDLLKQPIVCNEYILCASVNPISHNL